MLASILKASEIDEYEEKTKMMLEELARMQDVGKRLQLDRTDLIRVACPNCLPVKQITINPEWRCPECAIRCHLSLLVLLHFVLRDRTSILTIANNSLVFFHLSQRKDEIMDALVSCDLVTSCPSLVP